MKSKWHHYICLILLTANFISAFLTLIGKILQRDHAYFDEPWGTLIGLCFLSFLGSWFFCLMLGLAGYIQGKLTRPIDCSAMHPPYPKFCKRCNYLLHGINSNYCPECGRPVDLTDPKTYRTHESTLLNRFLFFGKIWFVLASLVVLIFLWRFVGFLSPLTLFR